ncbi:cupin domain-containing protein [bacterium]|nr:cupin domain-containing protein [bacterium]MBU1071658.1 cupin domain-containing protein [bacterium]MBU1676131.1 cupin domain-containing protein [bacterium]
MPGYANVPSFLQALPEIDLPISGARGWLLQGEGQQVVFVEFGETVDVPEHGHAEQWEFAVAGRVDLHIDGGTIGYTAGDNFFIPAGVPHGATVHAGYKALIVFNAPDRYLPRA